MHMIIVGLGSKGGSEIVNNFAELLKKENITTNNNDQIITVCIDTDPKMTQSLESKSVVNKVILINKSQTINDVLEKSKKITVNIAGRQLKYYRLRNGSIYNENHINQSGVGGVGQKRAVSNMLLFEVNNNFNAVYEYFDKIYGQIRGGGISHDTKYMVWIIAGAGGGSGSGLTCGVSRIIKSIFGDNCDIHILALLPVGQKDGDNFADISNSYIFIKELEYLWKQPNNQIMNICERNITFGGSRLFSTVNFIAMHHFSSQLEGEVFIRDNIIPNFLKMFQYGSFLSLDGASERQRTTFQPLIEMQNFDNALSQAQGRYGSMNFFEVYFDYKKLTAYCEQRDKVEIINKNLNLLITYKQQIKELLYGSNKFNSIKDNSLSNKDKKTKLKDIWNTLIKNAKSDGNADESDLTYMKEELGLRNLEIAYEMIRPFLADNEDSRNIRNIHEEVRNKIRNLHNRAIELMKNEMNFKKYLQRNIESCKKLDSFEKINKQLESDIEETVKVYIGNNEEYIKLSKLRKEILDSSNVGTVQTFPKFDKSDKEQQYNNELFDNIYTVYADAKHLDYSLSDFISKLKESPTQFASERMQNFFSVTKEYSIFDYNVSEQHHPISWAICLSHDDAVLINEWKIHAAQGFLMAGRDKRLHTLDPILKSKIWKKNRWCVTSWINGYSLKENKDFRELEERFSKLGPNRYLQITYPEAFGEIIDTV